MNHRAHTHLRVGVRRALHCLTLMLLPAATPKNLPALTHSGATAGPPNTFGPEPYLPALGAPALRFQLAAPPPDLTTRPAASAPPVPALSPTEATVVQANLAAAHSSAPEPITPTPPGQTVAVQTPSPAPVAPTTPTKPAPPPILPDDTRHSVRPEDFLPYFQMPGSARLPNDINLIVPAGPSAPAPAPLPPSTATYTQSPK